MNNVNDNNTTTADIGAAAKNTVVGNENRQTVSEYEYDRQININVNASTDEWRQSILLQFMALSDRVSDLEENQRAGARPLTTYEKLTITGFAALTIATLILAYVVFSTR
jgi:hypothetical protein